MRTSSVFMKAVFFSNWSHALESSGLPDFKVRSHQIAIRWFLSYLKVSQQPATVLAARDFLEFAVEEKNPEPWMVERWKSAINWFFSNAPVRKELRVNGEEHRAGRVEPGGDGETGCLKSEDCIHRVKGRSGDRRSQGEEGRRFKVLAGGFLDFERFVLMSGVQR